VFAGLAQDSPWCDIGNFPCPLFKLYPLHYFVVPYGASTFSRERGKKRKINRTWESAKSAHSTDLDLLKRTQSRERISQPPGVVRKWERPKYLCQFQFKKEKENTFTRVQVIRKVNSFTDV